MVKHIIAIILLSVVILFTMAYAQQGLELLISVHDWISEILTEVFSDGDIGDISRQLIALLVVPVIIGLIPAVIYWIIHHSWFPYFMQFVWVIWLVQTAALVVLFK